MRHTGGSSATRSRAPRSTSRGKSRVVHYGDLDLSSAYGVRRLHDRIERAAVDACQDMDNTPGLYVMDSDVDCIGGAVDRAMAEAPIPENAAYQGYGYRYRY